MMDGGIPERLEGSNQAAESRTDLLEGSSLVIEHRDLVEDEAGAGDGHEHLSLFEDAALAPIPESLPEPIPELAVIRHPNFADAMLFLLMLLVGALGTTAGLGLAIYFHWFGLRDLDAATKSTPVALGRSWQFTCWGLRLPYRSFAWLGTSDILPGCIGMP